MRNLTDSLFDEPSDTPVDTASNTPSAFSRGLRAGMEDIAGQTHALLGQGGEIVGASGYAAEQRAKSLANQQEAERLVANTPTLDKVDGLRSGWDYGTGLVGRSLPALGAGVAGAALAPGTGPLAAIAGMTLATAPSTIGAQFEAQQNDPEQAGRSVLDRTTTGVLAGTGQAAAMSIVPAAVGGKLFARAAESAAVKTAKPLGEALAHNVPEAVLGNAAAGNVSARIGQEAASNLNPNRDTSMDEHERAMAAAEGALMGAPFAALGTAGSMRGKKPAVPANSFKDLPRSTEAERTNGTPLFADKVNDLGSSLKVEPTTATEHADANLTPNDTPETVAAKDAQGQADAVAKAQRTMQKLLSDPSAERFQGELAKLDINTDAGQMRLRDINAQHFEAKQAEAKIKQANAELDAASKTELPDVHFSKDFSGGEKGIYDSMSTPEWDYLGADAKQQAASMVRKFITIGEETGDAPPAAMRVLADVLGKQTVSRLTKIYDVMGSKDPAKIEAFYKALSKVSDIQKSDDSLLTTVRNALPDHMIDSVKTYQLKEFVAQMKDLTGERMFKNMTPAEQAVKKEQINAKLQEVFGDKADQVNEAFAKHAQDEAKLIGTTPADATAPGDHEFSLTQQEPDTAYFGGGKKGTDFIENRDVARAKYGAGETAHERLMKKAQDENPGADVSWISAKDYAKEHGIPDEKLMEMTKGKPEDHGMVVAKKVADPEAFTWKDIDAMRLSGEKSSHYESKSRIDTGTGGPILDAVRIASHMMKKMKHTETDEQGGMHRLARAFKEGIAAVSDHMTQVLHVPDETVVARRGGKDVTWGELQKVRDDTAKGEPNIDPAALGKLKRDLNKLELQQARVESSIDPELRRRQHAGEPLSSAEFSELQQARAEWKKLQQQKLKLEDDIAYQEHQADVQRLKDAQGKTDLTADDNIHVAAAGSKADEMQRKVGMDGQHLQTDVTAKSVVPKGHLNEGSVTDIGRKALGSRISTYEAMKTDGARAIGKRARALLNNFDNLTPTHQAELAKIIKYENPSSAASIVNSLAEKYTGSSMTKAEYRAEPTQQKWANTIANEGGEQHKATLAQIARRTDPKALQNMLDVLRTDKKPNEFKQGLIDAVNKRIGDLIEKNPEVGYGMLVKGNESPETKFSLMSVKAHQELGREGFPAAHDSPIRHEGKFDWREHQGKGEGATAFGAGTYLSTAEGVHRSYKEKFTATIKESDPAITEQEKRVSYLKDMIDEVGISDAEQSRRQQELIKARNELARLNRENAAVSPTYHVSVDIKPEQLMDWSKSLSEQSKFVKDALAEAGIKSDGEPLQWDKQDGEHVATTENGKEYSIRSDSSGLSLYQDGDYVGSYNFVEDAKGAAAMLEGSKDVSGKDLYTSLTDKKGSQTKASDYLQSLGILGHKYAAAGGKNDAHPNFVIYDDSKINTNFVEFSRENTNPAKGSTAGEQKAVVDYINKVTGGSVDVNAAAKLLYAGSYIEGGADHRPAINVSVHAFDPTSVAYHESLHWLADDLRKNGDPKVFAELAKVADSAYMRNFLRNQFKDQPEALKQVMDSVEERVAYMYQFHANGMLKLGDRGRTLMEQISDYIKKVLGIWTNDQRAAHIMDYFHSGEYAKNMGDRSAVYRHMMEQGRNKTLDYLHKASEPLINLMDSVAGIGSARINDMGIPALTKLVDMTRKHATKEGADAGYLPAAGIAMRTFSNKMVNRMGKFSFEEANEAFAAIALGKAPKNDTQARLMQGMRETMDEMHGYLRDAGVNVGDRGFGKNYIPRQWDSAYVAGHQAEFKAMIDKYIKSGEYEGTAEGLMSRLMRDEGSEMESADAQARPGDQHVKKRELSFITPEDAAPFLEKNAMRVLTSYIRQGTRRAEWSRRFEMKGAGETLTPMEKLREAAIKQGATPEQMKVVDNYLAGITGQLGSDVRPETRKLFGQMMVYQNLRLLPLGFFSSLIDPVGVAVRGGGVRDVFNNFKRGIMEIPRGFQKNPKYDEGYHFAEDMGVIDNAVLQHVMGASYGLNAVGNKARAVNEKLFQFNLMEQMNTSQRVAASEAAMGFLKKHKDGNFNEHSARYLAELGLKPSDIKIVDGRVAARAEDFIKAGFKADEAEAAHLKIKSAINQWVDGAVLRPDQSQKAIWMNDAHFSLIAHMKQFAFSFQDTILKRVAHEMKHGNYTPAAALAGYIPVMLTADLMKGAIQGGGSQPDWKQDWGLDDYLSSAVQRAGLLGVGQFGVDAFKELHHGGTGLGALGGPTINQLGEVVSTVGGSRQFSSTLIDSMPANALWSGYLPSKADGFSPTELNTVD